MRILNFGGGEIWGGIEAEVHKHYPDSEILSVQKQMCDVGNGLDVERIYQLFKPDWVIYTAGVSHIQTIEDMNVVLAFEEFRSNMLGMLNVAHHGVKNGVKNYISLISVAGLYGKPNHSGYSASKMALRSFIESMAMEGLNAYGISPGRVDTAMRRKDYPNDEPGTCLSVKQVGAVALEIMAGKHQPGDNVIIRKRGQRVLRRRDRNGAWKKYLNVQPL